MKQTPRNILGRKSRLAWFVAAAAVLPVLLAGGCGTGRVEGPEAQLVADEDSSAFLDRLSSQETVSTHDALRGVILLLDGEDPCGDFAGRVAHLRERGVLPAEWDLAPETPITRGRYAVLIHQAGGFPLSVMLLAGPTERYCLRELQYRGVMVQGAFYSPVNGLEYVSVLRRADVYRRTGEVPDPSGSIDDL
jgi:hypothetical protein